MKNDSRINSHPCPVHEVGANPAHSHCNCALPVSYAMDEIQTHQIPASENAAHTQGAPKFAGILYRAGCKVLLMKRVPPSPDQAGHWAFPAGTIELGETPGAAAMREFFEETGKLLDSAEPAGVYGAFELFKVNGQEFIPTMNEEHSEFVWADVVSLPSPLHPGVAEQIASCAMDYADTAREADGNGFVTIRGNPISRAGVFMYSGKNLPGANPNQFYGVLRPAEELASPETLASFKLLPIIDEHEMLGDGYNRAAEDKGVHGATCENVHFDGRDIRVDLRIFSNTLKRLIDAGKRGLSAGYRCVFEKSAGVFEGLPYDYIQRQIRGNHLALVNEGRCGTAVLDHSYAFDHFDLALDTQEKEMADENTPGEGEGKKDMSIGEISKVISDLMPLIAQINEFMAAAKPAAAADPASALDADEDDDGEKKKKSEAEDADEDDDDKKKKGEGMDAAEIMNRFEKLEKRTTKDVLAEVAERNRLAAQISEVVGTFDHNEMDALEVAAYGLKQFNITAPKGTERAVLGAYLQGRKANDSIGQFAMDTAVKPESKLAGTLAKRKSN